MDNNLDKIAKDLYGKIETRFSNIRMGDETSEILSKKVDIPKARFFEFEYTEDGESLGTIAITLDKDDGVVVQVSGDLVDDNSNTTHHNAFKFIRSFRKFAKNRLLNFDVQNIGKSNLDKRDYQFQAKPKEHMMENKMFGTSRISYQDLGEARLIVKHNQPINPELAAGRTMHIECIYIENAEGERFKYPYKHLPGARALAEHIKHGGIPYDDIGKHITKLSEELASLRKFKGYVSRQSQISESMGDVTLRVIERIESVKKEIVSLQRPAYYQQFAESFTSTEEKIIPETVMNDWIERLTVRTFNEDMKTVFPFLYNIVDESELPICKLSPDYFIDDIEPEDAAEENTIESFDPEFAFESFINRIMMEDENEIFSSNKNARTAAIEKLNGKLQNELKQGPDLDTLKAELKGLIDDPAFFDELEELNVNKHLDIRALLQAYVTRTDADVAKELKFGDDQIGGTDLPPAADGTSVPPLPPVDASAPAPEPNLGGGIGGGMPPDLGDGMPPEGDLGAEGEVPPAPEGEVPPAPEGEVPPPVQEGFDNKKSKIKAKFIKAKAAGADLDTLISEGMTMRDLIRESGMTPCEAGFGECDMDDAEGGEPEEENISGIKQILNSIEGFWNKEENNFTIGGTRIKTKIIKSFKDNEYSNASEDDVKYVIKKVSKLDPSSGDQEQTDVLRLAGVNHTDHDTDDGQSIEMLMKELQGFGGRRRYDSLDKQKIRKTMRNNYERNFKSRASKFR